MMTVWIRYRRAADRVVPGQGGEAGAEWTLVRVHAALAVSANLGAVDVQRHVGHRGSSECVPHESGSRHLIAAVDPTERTRACR